MPIEMTATPQFALGELASRGMIGAAEIALLPPEDHDPDGPNAHRLRSAGKPNGNVELRIVDPDTFEDVPTGQVGEILTRSNQNMVGYWKNEDGTRSAYVDGDWFRTGDIGYFDDDGYLYIHDRVKDMIVSGGENVYPAEVENALMKHPAVADVAVIGVPDENRGQIVKAFVVLKAGQTGDAAMTKGLQDFVKATIAPYKYPRAIEFRDALPKAQE